MTGGLHPLLRRQLKKLGGDETSGLPPELWRMFLERINQAYVEHDQERYTLERSLSLSSEEMQDLNQKVEKHAAVLRQILTRYVAEEVADDILSNPDEKLRLGGETRLLTVLIAQVRGYTPAGGMKDARVMVEMLNAIFQRLVPVVFDERGTFDKFMGDSIIAFFGAPTSYEDDACRAVRAAVRMNAAMNELRGSEPRLSQLAFRAGIVTGYAVVGNLGSDRVMSYTCIGDTPNLAKSLQEAAGVGRILVCPATYEAAVDIVDAGPSEMIQIKGKKAPILAYSITGLKESESR